MALEWKLAAPVFRFWRPIFHSHSCLMNRSLLFIALTMLPISLMAAGGIIQATSLTSQSVPASGQPYWLIDADATDGLATTNRHKIAITSSLIFPIATTGTYTSRVEVVRSSDSVVVASASGGSTTIASSLSPISRTLSAEVDPRVNAAAAVGAISGTILKTVAVNVTQAGEGYTTAPTATLNFKRQLGVGGSLVNDTLSLTTMLDGNGGIASVQTATLPVLASTTGMTISIPAPPPLDPTQTYLVRSVLLSSVGARIETSTVVAASRWLNFTGTLAGSATRNAFLDIVGPVTVSRRHLLMDAVAGNPQGQFQLSVPCRVYRYDNWTAAAPGRDNLTAQFQLTLQDDLGATINLDAVSTSALSNVPQYTAGMVKTPSVTNQTVTLAFRPTTPAALDFLNRTYTVAVRELQISDDWEVPIATETQWTEITGERLLPLSGVLKFGVPVISTTITALNSVAIMGSGLPNLRLNIGSAVLTGTPGLSFTDASVLVSVDANGVCLYNETDVINVTSTLTPALEKGSVRSVDFVRSNYRLDDDGLMADLLVTLPAGALWSDSSTKDSSLFQTRLSMTDVSLNQTRVPIDATATYSNATGVYVADESKPLIFSGNALLWQITQGQFELQGPLDVSSFDQAANDYLHAAKNVLANVDPTTADFMDYKRSNDFVHSTANSPSYVAIVADSTTGSSQLMAEYDLGGTDYRTHLPYDGFIQFGGGHVKVDHDQVLSDSSGLTGVNSINLFYNVACTDTDCVTEAEFAQQTIYPSGSTLKMTAGGGLWSLGPVSAAPLSWGKRSAGGFAHGLVNEISEGVFMAADTVALSQHAPTVGAFAVLNTGYCEDAATGDLLAEAPASAAYAKGLGDYPGINYRIIGSTFQGYSNLGGTTVNYTMREGTATYAGSKYYTRWGGVSGIHDAELDPDSASPKIYDYSFSFSNYGFNLLGSEMRDSLIEGSIFFDVPSNFTQEFKQLQISCRGELEELTPLGVEKKLEHWDCAFEVLAASFVRSSSEACSGGNASYITNIRARSHHVPTSFVGKLGLMPGGEIISAADGRYDHDSLITSRFVLPRNIEIQGPKKVNSATDYETWVYSSVQDAYLSDWDATTAHSKGFWNLIGTLDVPFFRDLQVHLQLIAIDTVGGASDPDSAINIMGGWPTGGWVEGGGNPFDLALFDLENRGLPADMILEDYRNGPVVAAAAADAVDGSEPANPFAVKAAQTWLEVVDFDYELTWDPVTKSFEAKEIPGSDLLVINIGHQCLRISPDYAEINFGFSYDGLPQINLSQMAFNAIDESTGVASSLLNSLGSQGFDALTGGVDRFAKLVGDRMDQVIDEHVDQIMGPPLSALTTALSGRFTAGYSVDSIQIQNDIKAAMGVGSSAAGTVKKQIEQIVNAGGSAVNLSKNIVAQMDEVLRALDACANLNRYGAGVDDAAFKDFFNTLPIGPSDPTVLESFAQDIVTSFAAAITADILESVWATILEKHEDKVIAVEEALAQVYVRVKAVRDELNSLTGDFNKELEEIMLAAKSAGEIETAINQASEDIIAMIQQLSSMDVEVNWALISDQQKAQWLQAIKNQLHATPFVAKISTAIKERLYDLEGRMHSAIDSGIDALNDMLKDAIKDQLAGLDESYNNLLGGKLDNIVGAGQFKGYAHITTDSLELLRLDGSFRWTVPDEMKLDAYLEIRAMNSEGDGTCAGVASNFTEVELGAMDVPLQWLSPDLHADVNAKFAFGGGDLIGFGGGFKMRGALSYEAFIITDLQAQIAFGETENYLAAEVGLAFSSYQLKGGIFFGRCCTPDPIAAIDPDVASLIPGPTFTGAYAYGEGWIPIIGNGCFFNISAGVGAGAFYFAEGPTYGGKMLAGVSGEALCAVSVKGDITLIGVKNGNDFSFSGTGSIKGKAGVCPLCVKFSENVTASYSNGSWDVDY